jgi:hypothetical protein
MLDLAPWAAIVRVTAVLLIFLAGGILYLRAGRTPAGAALLIVGLALSTFLWSQLPQLRNVFGAH